MKCNIPYRLFVTKDLTELINETKGNQYIRLSYASKVNEYYMYVLSFTVFTSSLKFCKLLAFNKNFLQVKLKLLSSIIILND